jgi:S-adenosylmethionine-diacylgycerolhomoserine-N-methlytransferase
VFADARVLLSLLRGQPRGGDHAQRLAAFYGPQAGDYDRFRERLLNGRRELVELLDPAPGTRFVELGGGTGRNLEFLGERRAALETVWLVDLCAPLLEQARRRASNWPNVRVVEADATTWQPEAQVHAVMFSYSLTMIPDWFRAVDNAWRMLAPGGVIGVVDFHVSRRDPAPGRARHRPLTRSFWRGWFDRDGVFPSPDHLPYLESRFATRVLLERSAQVPYLPFVRVPWYLFVGVKRRRDPEPAGLEG